MAQPIKLPTITVQHDLPVVLQEICSGLHAVEDCWISIYDQSTSVHGKVRISEGGTAGTVDLEARDGVECVLVQLDPPCLDVSCASLNIPPTRVSFPPSSATSSPKVQLKGGIDALAFASDGSRLVMGGKNGLARVAELAGSSRGVERPLRGHVGDITHVQFFPSNEVVLTASLDMSVRIFSALDGSNPRTLTGHTRAVTSLAILGRGREVLSASLDGTLRQWNVATGTCTRKWTLSQPISCMTLFRGPIDENIGVDGSVVIIGHSNGTATVLEVSLTSQGPIATLHTGAAAAVDSLAGRPESGHVALGSRTGVIYMFDIKCLLAELAPVPDDQGDSRASSSVDPLLKLSRSGAAVKSLAFVEGQSESGQGGKLIQLLVASADGQPCRLEFDLATGSAILKEDYAGLDCDAANCIGLVRGGAQGLDGVARPRVYVAAADGQVRFYA